MLARRPPLASAMLVLALFAVSCASNDPTSIEAVTAQEAPLATTPPIALPPTADPESNGSEPSVLTPEPAPTVVVEEPTATPEPAPTVVVEEPTAVPEPASTVVVEEPTAVPEPAPSVVVEEPPPTSVETPPANPGGARIALVDVPVVNLLTGGTTSLGDLSPNGATLLFFWAPH